MQKPTKQFLEQQIEACKQAIFQNQGALNLCLQMLKSQCFVEEETAGQEKVQEEKEHGRS